MVEFMSSPEAAPPPSGAVDRARRFAFSSLPTVPITVAPRCFAHRIDRARSSGPKERITIRVRTHDRLGRDIGAGTWPILNDEWLAEPLRQPLAHQACDNIGRAAGGKADDNSHRPRR